jgi:hypothetical protein|tara:strand:+ start:1482 stop:1949 length:468 start_codon:yes stop_codon:yes gene_type:complete
MSQDTKKVVKFDPNYKNRSPIEELVEQLQNRNKYLEDALRGAVQVITKFSKSGYLISIALTALNNAKNNFERGKHSDVALKNVGKLSRDLHPFRSVINALRHKEDLYSSQNKKHTLNLGSLPGAENFGMHHANEADALSDAIDEAEKQWTQEENK